MPQRINSEKSDLSVSLGTKLRRLLVAACKGGRDKPQSGDQGGLAAVAGQQGAEKAAFQRQASPTKPSQGSRLQGLQ